MAEHTLIVPWLGISTNVAMKSHGAKLSPWSKSCKLIVASALQHNPVKVRPGPVNLTFQAFLAPGVRQFDTTNYSICVKMLEDALVFHGVLPDDRAKYVHDVLTRKFRRDRDAEHSYFVITITEVDHV